MTNPAEADLVGWWRLEEGSGTAVRSEIDSPAKDATIVGGGSVEWIDNDLASGANTSYALQFSGTGGDFVQAITYTGIGGNNPRSVTAWIKTSEVSTNDVIVSWGENSTGNRFTVRENAGWGGGDDGNRMEFRIDAGRTRAEGGGGNTQGDTVMNDGQWHHIAVTVQPNSIYSSGIELWLDGQLDTRSNSDPDPWHPIADFDVKIGIRYNESGREFTGDIDDVRIYERVLTHDEVAGLAGKTLPFDKPF